MTSSSGGHGGGTFSGRNSGGRNSGGKSPGDKGCEDASQALLKELVARLQDHSDSLQRDIKRLQRALTEINGAIALSLDRVERLRANTERLQAIFGVGQDHSGQGDSRGKENHRQVKDRRSGAERRSGADRRRARSEVSGLLRWIEGTSLDRRKVLDRRTIDDRRRLEQSAEKHDRLVVPVTFRRRACGDVVSLAEYRRARNAAGKPQP